MMFPSRTTCLPLIYLSTLFAAETEVMATIANFSKHESLSAVKKDKQVGNKAMFGTNKLFMKGICLPTFQRSIILRANEGYKTFTQLFTQFDNLWREKLVSLLVYLYKIYRFYTDFSLLFRQIKRQDTVVIQLSNLQMQV